MRNTVNAEIEYIVEDWINRVKVLALIFPSCEWQKLRNSVKKEIMETEPCPWLRETSEWR